MEKMKACKAQKNMRARNAFKKMKACKGPKKLKACTKQMHEDTQIRKEREAHKFSTLALIENSCEHSILRI